MDICILNEGFIWTVIEYKLYWLIAYVLCVYSWNAACTPAALFTQVVLKIGCAILFAGAVVSNLASQLVFRLCESAIDDREHRIKVRPLTVLRRVGEDPSDPHTRRLDASIEMPFYFALSFLFLETKGYGQLIITLVHCNLCLV